MKHKSDSIITKHKSKIVISSDSEDEKVVGTFQSYSKSFEKNKLQVEKNKLPISVDEYFGDELVKMKWTESNADLKSNQSVNAAFISSEFGKCSCKKGFLDNLNVVDKGHSFKKEKITKPGITEFNIHSDENFDKTLEDLDDNDIIHNLDILDETIEEATKKTSKTKKSGQKASSHKKSNLVKHTSQNKRQGNNLKEGEYLLIYNS